MTTTTDAAILMQRALAKDEAAGEAITKAHEASQSNEDLNEDLRDAVSRLESGRVKDSGEGTEVIASRLLGGSPESSVGASEMTDENISMGTPEEGMEDSVEQPNVQGPQNPREEKLLELVGNLVGEIRALEKKIKETNQGGASVAA